MRHGSVLFFSVTVADARVFLKVDKKTCLTDQTRGVRESRLLCSETRDQL